MTHRRFPALAAVFLVVTVSSYADINDGLISAWTFDDGTARDANGKSDGTLEGAASITADGRLGKGLDLDGGDSFVQIPHVKAFEVMEDAFTVSAWAFVRAGKDHSAIAWKGTGIGWGPNFAFRIATTSNTNITWGSCPAGIEGWFATDGAIAPNEWLHLCMTADGAEIAAYVNAELPAATAGNNVNNPSLVAGPYQSFPGEPIEIGAGRNIGAAGNGVSAFLDGVVDEVYFYDRALTPDEVTELSGGARPNRILAIDAAGKIATAWGALKERR